VPGPGADGLEAGADGVSGKLGGGERRDEHAATSVTVTATANVVRIRMSAPSSAAYYRSTRMSNHTGPAPAQCMISRSHSPARLTISPIPLACAPQPDLNGICVPTGTAIGAESVEEQAESTCNPVG
jgi:hypothetical protein